MPDQVYLTEVESTSIEALRIIVIMQNRILNVGHDISAIMQTVVDSAHEMLGVEGAAIEVIDGTDLVYKSTAGPGAANTLGVRVGLQKSLSGLSIRQNRVLTCDDTELDERVDKLAARKIGIRSMIVTPLITPRAAVGVLKLLSSKPNSFGQEHQRVVTVLASFITRAMVQAEETQAHNRRFESLANSLPNLVWIANEVGEVYWFNSRWYEYTGTTPEEMENGGWHSVHDPQELPRTLQHYLRGISTGEPVEMMFTLRRRDGEYRWFLTRAVPIKDEGGRVTKWFGTNTDIHDQRQAALEAAHARDEAERASRLKTAFLANMSHEIRTPLGVMIGFADMLVDPHLDEGERTKYVAILRRNGEQLGRLINDILDLSKIESGLNDFEYASIDPAQLAREVVASLSLKAEHKKLALRLECAGECPEQIVTDLGRARQILTNLIDNAIKFTETGSIVIRLSSYRQASNDQVCAFDVTDTGIGINEQSAERLFRMFTQADNSMTRKYGGTGLGLALSRSLARAMGGDVKLMTTAPGQGSAFRFTVHASPDTNVGRQDREVTT